MPTYAYTGSFTHPNQGEDQMKTEGSRKNLCNWLSSNQFVHLQIARVEFSRNKNSALKSGICDDSVNLSCPSC